MIHGQNINLAEKKSLKNSLIVRFSNHFKNEILLIRKAITLKDSTNTLDGSCLILA